jgi:Protein of unknown function (DUF2937)
MLRWSGRFIVGVAAAVGALFASQFPEFTQQYRQRLGGALQELHDVLADFDATAAHNHMSRDEAVRRLQQSDETFVQDQAVHTSRTIIRFEELSAQRSRLDSSPYVMRPVVVLSYPDTRVVRGAWDDYEPAVPVTPAGFVWAAIGFFIAGGLVSLLRQTAGIAWRRRKRLRHIQR